MFQGIDLLTNRNWLCFIMKCGPDFDIFHVFTFQN